MHIGVDIYIIWVYTYIRNKEIPPNKKEARDMRKGTRVEYKGRELVKVAKNAWNIKLNGEIIGYANNLKNAKAAIDMRTK